MKQSSPYVKSDWNILAISHRVAYIICEAQERQSSVAAGAVESKIAVMRAHPPKHFNDLNSPMPLYVNVIRILALMLNKVRHFYYSFLNSLCFSWNGRALWGAHLPCSGVSPLGALLPHPPHCWFPPSRRTERYVRFCNRIETLPANQNNEENPNPNSLSEQIIQILISFKRYLVFFFFLLSKQTTVSGELCGGTVRGQDLVCYSLIISEESECVS